ncbi:PP2C family protein-serine/threonine phosphatase [Streptomyces sp. NRRL S-87]|uniref:PP2C family protein-serine/threonine phosphatase n=1 Tax=Streptomyces sp. NRRL S-87 TaxID=1463920 RepID=UPI0004C1458D|nr:PP2C family protein-serine/threonine phosphatase [Streptomyces sp. NRRL S-87]
MRANDAVLAEVLEESHTAPAGDIPRLIDSAARRMGLTGARLYVSDVQQVLLLALPQPGTPPQETELPVDGSLGGLAYRTQKVRESRDGTTAWVPMVDGIERIGVMRATAPSFTPAVLQASRSLAGLATLLVVSKSTHSDLLVARERARRMSVQAELLWAFLPPRTIGTDRVTSSAVLEPAYDIGGDAFDHSFSNGGLHLMLVDAMGHDLASGQASALAMAACRATRRSGGSLADIVATIDRTLEQWMPQRLMTAVFAHLDSTSGDFTWTNCGHPPPLLIRDGRIVPHALERHPELPLGFAFHSGHPPALHHARLQPGDRVLLHSDGVTEARSTAGELFGEQRLVDTVVRSTASGDNAPEALRRLIVDLLHHQDHRLHDDATILLSEWHP